jgi:enediyne polyketide synthase
MSTAIAIVGMACCYADARSPQELWENVLARRRAFRRLPAERLLLRDYFSADTEATDAIYSSQAAVIADYEFDRVGFRVSGPIFRSVDMAHWLALDIAGRALEDAGFGSGSLKGGGRLLPQESTGVLVGNTLTGEFSRAATLRLRWPYVRRIVEARLLAEGWDEQHRSAFLGDLEQDYKAPFAPVGEETLAGALSNTIAGRICNHFHLGGGGYTLDGACCSSLLAVARACSALETGELDLALAGGVDLSLDPFELVGFAKAGALAHGEMLVYDRASSGFLPGEGSGFVVLMRDEDARSQGLRSYGAIRGWGISSDGGGSITRPEIRGQVLALRRAYQRAGYEAETVALFEGHGTGTPVGDEVELQALRTVREPSEAAQRDSEQSNLKPPAAVSSIKANIGHTKAAAGVAGLIKAALAIHHQILPPATGTHQPRPELQGGNAALRVLENAEPWPETLPLRAGVNSFGFGGINVHVTLEGVERRPGSSLSPREQILVTSAQDAELFLFSATSRSELGKKLELFAERALGLSYAELADASAALAGEISLGAWRAAAVAASPAQLGEQLLELRRLLEQGVTREISPDQGVFMGVAATTPRIAFLFPGQASPVRLHGGAHGRRFSSVRELYCAVELGHSHHVESTAVAQIAIATAEAAGLRMMSDLGIEASVAAGHSLGELAAYLWADAMDEDSLLALVRARGHAMSELPGPAGVMASISATASEVESLLKDAEAKKGGESLVIACFNAPQQIVVAGESDSVARVLAIAKGRGWNATLLATANAFHSPLMAPAKTAFQKAVDELELRPLRRRVVSTITGTELPESSILRALLVEQLTSPVRFSEALAEAAKNIDLLIEVGPGQVLSHLANDLCEMPALSLDVAGPSMSGVLKAAAAVYVLGGPLRTEVLFKDRFVRPFDLTRRPSFFANPCEMAPVNAAGPSALSARDPRNDRADITANQDPSPGDSPLDVVRMLIARRTELPPAAISADAHLLRDLHLNSIVVGELVASAARQLGFAPPRQLLEFADATVGETAKALERLGHGANDAAGGIESSFPGVDQWLRAFFVEWVPRALRPRSHSLQPAGRWKVFAPRQPELASTFAGAALPGNGVIVCLPLEASLEEQAGTLLEAAHAALQNKGQKRYFVVIGAAGAASAFARTLHLEDADIATRIIEAPLDSRVVDRAIAEVNAAGACLEARYDKSGSRAQACLRLLAESKEAPTGIPLGPHDVVLVSGGAKGIVAECSLMLARETGAALVILGRSRPEDDPQVTAHLQKLAGQGVRAQYFSTDVTDAPAVRSAVSVAEASFGRVTAIIHGAGHNHPKLLRDLDRGALLRTLAPKVQGLRNLMAAVDADGLRLLITFGSVIGRAGMRGEADYALANACQSFLTEEFAREHPACRCLAFESSAWSGIGMAELLGSLEALRRDGITTIPPERGVAWFRDLASRDLASRDLLSRKSPSIAVMLAGRLGVHPPLPMEGAAPLLRFLEKPRVYYPGVELVADADLTTASDPYLLDHVFHDQPLLPGVIALEAMTQAAMAVTGESKLPVLTDVRFERSLVVAAGARVTLRVAALVREPGSVEVVIRSSSTSFQVDHFRGVCSFEEPPLPSLEATPPPGPSRLAVDPERDLYGNLLFQSGRFRRLAGYRVLNARSCWAEIAPSVHSNGAKRSEASPSWFSQYLPSALVLGDAAARDAALHAVQACVPHAVLLPIGVKRLYAAPLNTVSPAELLVHASRRWVEGATYCYDVEIQTADGILCEKWEELKLRKIADAPNHSWPDPLVAAFLEWRVTETIPATSVAAAFDRDRSDDRRSRSERAIHKALDSPQPVHWRADGKPEVRASAMGVSAAHSNGLTLAVAGVGPVACDLEPVCVRSEQVWRDLLGRERWSLAELIAAEAGEDVQTSATRVWTALESLKKAEAPHDAPLVLLSCSHGKLGCVSLAASGLRIASSIVEFRDDPTQFAVSVLARSSDQR